MNNHLILKNKLKEFRKMTNLTQNDLANLVGTTQNTISAFETGQYSPSAYLAAKIVKVFDCKFEDIFYLDF